MYTFNVNANNNQERYGINNNPAVLFIFLKLNFNHNQYSNGFISQLILLSSFSSHGPYSHMGFFIIKIHFLTFFGICFYSITLAVSFLIYLVKKL